MQHLDDYLSTTSFGEMLVYISVNGAIILKSCLSYYWHFPCKNFSVQKFNLTVSDHLPSRSISHKDENYDNFTKISRGACPGADGEAL